MSGKRSHTRGSLFGSRGVPLFVQGSLLYDPPVDHTAVSKRIPLHGVTSAVVLLTDMHEYVRGIREFICGFLSISKLSCMLM